VHIYGTLEFETKSTIHVDAATNAHGASRSLESLMKRTDKRKRGGVPTIGSHRG
jgi:hypothetical protein